MKKPALFLALFLFAACCTLSAQPVIQSNVAYSVGDAYTLYEADSNLINPGPGGANLTWNYTNLVKANGTDPLLYEFVSPASTPYAGMFPQANVAGKILGDTVIYIYSKKDATQLVNYGFASLSYKVNYTDPDVLLKFPQNYNTSFTEAFAYTTDAGSGFPFYSKGTRTTTYDAYGTLKTPFGNFPNAMRIKAVSTQVDSADFAGAVIVNHTSSTTYDWLVANYPSPVTSVYTTQVTSETRIPGFDTLVTVSPAVKSINYMVALTTGVFDHPAVLSGVSLSLAGANPVADELALNIVADQEFPALRLMLTDLSGRVLHLQVLRAGTGDNRLSIPVNDLPAGVYTAVLTDGTGLQSLRWEKY